jgi:hypothetical protein
MNSSVQIVNRDYTYSWLFFSKTESIKKRKYKRATFGSMGASFMQYSTPDNQM